MELLNVSNSWFFTDLTFLPAGCYRLKSVQVVVDSLLGEELRVGPLLRHLASLDHNNAVSTVDSGETVSNDNGGPSLPGLVQCLLNHLLTLRVQGRGGLIKEEDLGVSDQCSSDGYPLLLSAAQLSALCSNIGVVALHGQEQHHHYNVRSCS